MKQIKKLGLVVVTLLLSVARISTSLLPEEPLPEQEARLRAPAIRQDKLLSVHCWMQSPKSKISPM